MRSTEPESVSIGSSIHGCDSFSHDTINQPWEEISNYCLTARHLCFVIYRYVKGYPSEVRFCFRKRYFQEMIWRIVNSPYRNSGVFYQPNRTRAVFWDRKLPQVQGSLLPERHSDVGPSVARPVLQLLKRGRYRSKRDSLEGYLPSARFPTHPTLISITISHAAKIVICRGNRIVFGGSPKVSSRILYACELENLKPKQISHLWRDPLVNAYMMGKRRTWEFHIFSISKSVAFPIINDTAVTPYCGFIQNSPIEPDSYSLSHVHQKNNFEVPQPSGT